MKGIEMSKVDNMPYWKKVESNAQRRLKEDQRASARETQRYRVDEAALSELVDRDNRLIRSGISVAGVGIVGGFIFVITGHILLGVLLLILIMTVGSMIVVHSRNHRYDLIKYSLVSRVLERHFHTQVYLAKKNIPLEIIHELEMVDDCDRAIVSDYFCGTWRGIPFSFGDIAIRGTGHREKQFSGQLFIIETGYALEHAIVVRERCEPLSAELYAARCQNEKFYRTGNEAFDRQFEVSIGQNLEGDEVENITAFYAQAHKLLDCLCQDIIDADAYAVSRTTMRFVGNRLYLAIENSRDTFELMKGDVQELDVLSERLEEEVRDMTLYLDKVCRGLEPEGEEVSRHFELEGSDITSSANEDGNSNGGDENEGISGGGEISQDLLSPRDAREQTEISSADDERKTCQESENDEKNDA